MRMQDIREYLNFVITTLEISLRQGTSRNPTNDRIKLEAFYEVQDHIFTGDEDEGKI